MKVTLLLIIMAFSVTVHASDKTQIDIYWMSEQYPPLNYSEDNVAKGLFVEILQAIWLKLHGNAAHSEIRMLPWARSYKLLQTTPNTALFAMSRTQERETLFKWVGPIDIPPIGIIASKAKHYRFSRIEELSQQIGNNKLGVVKDDSGEHYYRELGGDTDLLDRVSHGTQLLGMLGLGRLDAIAYSQMVAVYLMNQQELNPAEYELVLPLKSGAQGWFGFHKDTAQSTIDRYQQAFDQLNTDGTIERIRASYVQ